MNEKTWQVRYTRHCLLPWEVLRPIGKPSEEGTQAIDILAHFKTRDLADEYIRDHDRARLADRYAEALRVLGRCSRCGGDGSPQCVSCDDYQACRCRPGEGKYADKCWACKGTGIMSQTVREALIPEQQDTLST